MPPFVQTMLERRWLGDKTRQGFYKKEKDAEGKEVRLVLDWKTLEYHPAAKPKLPSLEMAKNAERLPDRLRQLLSGDVKKDKAARFHWRLLSALWNYAADCLPEIADDAASVDRAMRAGFNWEMGPFELWDAAGVRETVARMETRRARWSEQMLRRGRDDAGIAITGASASTRRAAAYRPIAEAEGIARVATFRASNGVVRQNPGASLVDLGDGVACIELHSKKNAIGEDIVRLVTETLRAGWRCGAEFRGVRDQRRRRPLLRRRQPDAAAAERAGRRVGRSRPGGARVPAHDVVDQVLPAPGGGGAVRLLPGRRHGDLDARPCAGRSTPSSTWAWWRPGVGLLPGGGGCKEMTLRAMDAAERGASSRRLLTPALRDDRDGQGFDLRGGGAAARILSRRAIASR